MKIPRSTQEMIPVKHILNDGTFVLDSGEYSKMFAFTDINYTELRDEEKMRRLVDYSALLNSIDKGIYAKISIFFRPIRQEQFERDVLIPMNPEDELDDYRENMNTVLREQVRGTLGMTKQAYLTITAGRRNDEDASDSWGYSWGYYVKINHAEGVDTLYAHLSSVAVSYGQYVHQGDVIGYVGSTGNSSGNHLHFELYLENNRVDPYPYIGTDLLSKYLERTF